jgi:hypothetical protein
MFCRKCGVELKPDAPKCRYCGAEVEDCFDEGPESEVEIAPLGRTPVGREPAILREAANQPDPSSAWLPGEDAVTVPITYEPYDLIPDETGEEQFPQFVAIPAPVWNGTAQPHETRLAPEPVESAILIPINGVPPRKSEAEPGSDYFLKKEPERQRRHVVSSVLLLLLAVIAVFILAWVAQR